MPVTRTECQQGVVLLAHGSPDDRHRAAIEHLARRVETLSGRPTAAAFLQHHGPTCRQAVSRFVAAGVAPEGVKVLPLLPSAGEHAQDDVGPATAGTGATTLPAVDAARLAGPLVAAVRGLAPRVLVRGNGQRIVLLAPGSRRSDPSLAFAGLSLLIGRALGANIDIVDRPSNLPLEAGIGIVVPVIWARGRLWDRLDRRISGTSIVTTPPLALVPATAEALATLVNE